MMIKLRLSIRSPSIYFDDFELSHRTSDLQNNKQVRNEGQDVDKNKQLDSGSHRCLLIPFCLDPVSETTVTKATVTCVNKYTFVYCVSCANYQIVTN